MTDGPPKPRNPYRVLAIGCTVVIGIGVVLTGVVGFVLYKIGRNLDEIAAIGSSWLARAPGAEAEFGEIQKVAPLAGRMSLDVRKGEGWFDYQVTGVKASGEARVGLVKRQGEWRPVGARLSVGGRDVPIGEPIPVTNPGKNP